jgi:hypothetical protein
MVDLREVMGLLGLSPPEEARNSDIVILEFIECGLTRSKCKVSLSHFERTSSPHVAIRDVQMKTLLG